MDIFYNNHMLPCIERFMYDLKDRVYTKYAPLNCEYFKTDEPVEYSERLGGEYRPIAEGEKWGELWDCAWFHFTGTVPNALDGKTVVLLLDVSGEGLIYDGDGIPKRGITSFSVFDSKLGSPIKRTYIWSECARAGETIDFYMDCGCNDLFGNFQSGTLKEAQICGVNQKLRKIYYDYNLLFKLLGELDVQSARYAAVRNALFQVSNTIVEYTDEELAMAERILAAELNKKGGMPSLEISALGHSHLDLAWLWPIRETKRKAERTFATALEMIARYPDYIYCVSQPQQLEWVKQHSPQLYEKISKQIAAGRIEPVGGMWVEPDLNVSSGESLIRQIVYGKRFFKEEFGVDVNNAWLPDVFGFNGNLPQILKKSGLEYLCTIKLSWNKYNKFPHHSFIWEGVDGSRVLCHMPPEGEYNSEAAPRSVKFAEHNYIEKGVSRNAMMLFGIGDGGAGAGSAHLELLQREKNIEGLCPVTMRTAKEFFKRLDSERQNLDTYRGEMYLEKHQGTYTTQAHGKRMNRLMETALKNAEMLSVLFGAPYEKEQLDTLWKETLLYQFHDILPGSSIARVYEENAERYSQMLEAAKSIAENIVGGAGNCLFNPTLVEREHVFSEEGKAFQLTLAPLSNTALSKKNEVKFDLALAENVMENSAVRAVFNADGEITSLVTKADDMEHAVLLNALNVYYDDGDCWDISDNYLRKPHSKLLLKNMTTETYPDRICRVHTYVFGDSIMKQVVTLAAENDFLQFDTEVFWKENGRMLRADFDTTVNANTCDYDIQFAKITRTTTSNNLTEYAIGEVAAQRYADFYDKNHGISVICDCKYGYRTENGRISVNLLRSPDYPGKNADRGRHEFSYLLYPHTSTDRTDEIAECLINPPISNTAPPITSALSFDCKNIAVSAIKRAEDGKGVVVRLYETEGKSCNALLHTTLGKTACECDLMENKIGKSFKAEGACLHFERFEIKTFRF